MGNYLHWDNIEPHIVFKPKQYSMSISALSCLFGLLSNIETTLFIAKKNLAMMAVPWEKANNP